ncbi:DNRLRE domain-containing protein [Dyadobacter flavalbus]|uniref:DNRLRE domain-containing protein n=1 Tax=Dyadobacter flavalbus TaxID=2579942 RepID=A0A5M8QVA7_9BACT|nr:ELWxxDGT repeat protein [Dyadobacter flavalbus]KAA6438990.1 DNRLRE domain-containing protein [Dyadobacter flavalbus]
MNKIVLFLAFSLISVQALLAQESGLVKDINVTRSDSGFVIHESIAADNMIYMIADNGPVKKGLWKSDGSANGTVLVKEFPGAEFVGSLSAFDGTVYFVVRPVASFYELNLYKSDGTSKGTILFQNLTTMPYANLNGTLYFFSTTGLRKTDGTAFGTVLLKKFTLNNEVLKEAVDVNGTVFFITIENGIYHKLYKSNGTENGTVELKDNLTGAIKVYSSLVAIGSDVYFSVSNAQGTGLYKVSNTAGVTLVKAFSSGVLSLTRIGSSLYFTASNGTTGNELWKTDGTTTGTVLVKDINPGAASSEPSMLTAIAGQLYFVANDGVNGPELWKSNATATELVKDIRPGSAGSDIRELIAVGSKAAFVANDGSGEKLWQSNGNVYGTKLLAELTASRLLNVQGTLYFNGNTGRGPELFNSTIVTGGTHAVTELARPGSMPLGFTQVNGVSYFTADDGIHGRELWKTDGSAAGTMLVSDIVSGANSSYPEQITNVNGTAYFVTGKGSQVHSLWKSNGTQTTTIKVKDFTKADTLQGLINVNGTLFFGIVNGSGSMQLWKSNGSTAGTQLVRTFAQTPTFFPVTMNGLVFFGAYDGINSVDLWKSNGTAAGTVLVKDLAVSRSRNNVEGLYTSITVAGNLVYYIVTDTEGFARRNRLVKSDGTAAGTTFITKVNSSFSKLTTVNNLVFYLAFHGGDDYDGEALWRTDGTEQGTFSVAGFQFYDYDRISTIFTHNMLAVNGNFYCVPKRQEQLWKSDGTVKGTQQISKIGSGEYGASIQLTASVGNTLYFSAFDETHRLKLWKTQGTAGSTSLAYDLNPKGSTLFYEIAALNNQLLISADNGRYGAELFKIKTNTENSMLINAGGATFTASGGRKFSADQHYEGIDRTSSVAGGDILHTDDDELYRSGRCSPSFSYNIPVPNGKVNVILHFAEIWYGVPGKGAGGAGKRQFNVTMEGSRKLTNFDIFAAAGGAMRAIQKSVPVTVTDGMLSIDFTSGAADMPRVSAIEIVQTSLALKPVADAYVRNGTYKNRRFGYAASLEIKNNNDADDLSTRRSSYLRFQLPKAAITSAILRVYGHNHENSNEVSVHAYGVDENRWGEELISNNNAPEPFTPSLGYAVVNEVYKYYEIDVSGYVKARQQAGETMVSLFLEDPDKRNTQVVFNSKENSDNLPQLIVQTPPENSNVARWNQEAIALETAQDAQESAVYPNPVKGRFTISVSSRHSEDISLYLLNSTGQSDPVITLQKARAGQKAEADISGLAINPGIYLLKIHSAAATEVLKLLVTE